MKRRYPRMARLLWLSSLPTMLTIHYLWRLINNGAKPFDWLALGLSLVAEAIVIWLIAYEIRTPAREKKARAKVLAKTFTLRLTKSSIQRADFRGLDIAIAFQNQVRIETFNVRFVEKRPDGVFVNAPPEAITVMRVAIKDLGDFMSPREKDADPAEGVTVSLRDNGFQKYPGEAMRLWLGVAPLKLWTGFISFQGFDADGTRQYARQPFSVVA